MLKKIFDCLDVLPGRRHKTLHLIHLINKERWRSVRKHLATEEGRSEALKSALTNNEECNVNTAVHTACSLQPPLDIVEVLVGIYPASLSLQDKNGRTALHVAASMWASLDVIKFLVEKCPLSLSVVDNEGKTPLILLLETASLQTAVYAGDKKGSQRFWEYIMEAAVFLCYRAPKTIVNIEDAEGKCALEYAITNNATIDVVRFLMRRSKAGRKEEAAARRKEAKKLRRKSSLQLVRSMVAPNANSLTMRTL